MRKIAFALLAHMIILCGCSKRDSIDPSFAVTTTSNTFKVGEPIQFSISGNPGGLIFYSGEVGKRFEFIKRVKAEGKPTLQFTSLAANGSQANSLALMVSDDFKGIGADEITTATNIKAANWKDITSKANLSAGSTTASGAIDLSDVAAAGKPIYIAFKYKGLAGSIQRKWTITALTVINTLADATVYTLANLNNTAITNYGVAYTTSPGWSAAKVASSYAWTISAGSSLVITGATTAAAATEDAEAWVFSGPIDLRRVTPDLGVSIKNLSNSLNAYSYSYPKAGTYNATFEGTVKTVYEDKSEIRQIALTITP